ncbi:MAG: hypothetical protein K2Q18_02515 [Bdellovibrionales bacterium]|nr:hypothetical protein [Bdellovibrionales bacterium]
MLWFLPAILDVWYRNSLCENYWVFGKSDIDITILVDTLSYDEGKKIAKYHRRLKFFIPVIGEVCFYDKKLMDLLKKCISPVELRRDKKLMQFLGYEKEITPVDQLIFLNKFFVNNILKKNLEKRPEKIKYYMQVAGLKKDFSLLSIKDFIKENAFLRDLSDYENLCRKAALQIGVGTNDIMSSHEYALLFNFYSYLELKTDFTYLDKEIIKKTLLWELWGIYSYQFFGDENIRNHISNLLGVSKKILNINDQNAVEDIAKKLNLI